MRSAALTLPLQSTYEEVPWKTKTVYVCHSSYCSYCCSRILPFHHNVQSSPKILGTKISKSVFFVKVGWGVLQTYNTVLFKFSSLCNSYIHVTEKNKFGKFILINMLWKNDICLFELESTVCKYCIFTSKSQVFWSVQNIMQKQYHAETSFSITTRNNLVLKDFRKVLKFSSQWKLYFLWKTCYRPTYLIPVKKAATHIYTCKCTLTILYSILRCDTG